jgi:hypothetical protein
LKTIGLENQFSFAFFIWNYIKFDLYWASLQYPIMHIFSTFIVFKFIGQRSAFRVSKLPLSLHSLSHGFFFVTLKFCGSGAKSSNAFNTNFLCVFKRLRFQLWTLTFECLRLEHLTFEVWVLSLSVWSLRSECRRFEHLRFGMWALNLNVWGLRYKCQMLQHLKVWMFKEWSLNVKCWSVWTFKVWVSKVWGLNIWGLSI